MPGKGINEKLIEVSVEVISFLEIMNQNFFSLRDHYKLQLPFRNTPVNLLDFKWATGR